MTQTSSQPKQRVVIIGGGFAGLNLVKTLDRNKFEVTLINRHNYHSFPPLFYQIASSGLDPGDICFPLRREMFRRLDGKNISLIMGNATAVDVNRHVVKLDDREVEYDKLVIATGTTNNFFNMPELQQDVYTLKSAPQAIRCRNQILYNLEKAANVTDPVERRRLLSFVVIGGGPTGVEIAGALGEMKRYVVPREYPSIPQEDMRILLVEAAPKLLGTMDPRSSEEVEGYLKHLLVDVKTGVGMQSYKEGIVQLADGETIDSDTVIWTAGVTGVKLDIEGADIERGRGNRFVVDGQNRVKGIDDVYAIGDIAIMPDVDPAFPGGHPQLAQVAIQQSRLLAKNLNKDANKSFVYNDKGTMATVGRNRAVADLGKLHLKGFPAWFIWMFIHLISILGMRNKISVLINWIWAYFSYQSSLRVLIRPDKYPVKNRWREK
ncbi:MAG: NAD(P)/FAD-dependent oxidoreductase [Bacteroides sp.]|nr:NAD(P)/FAD-dependent oxidoreductase [Bacteroides sp.]MBD5351682.1 NAD(P)/FAD-dependent oxidoreductase [Bacteroides sp.]MBD5362810.1 NAD(P)/FAD-dependent oxidoreductase [Bacteroides sp.]MBD5363606.1 NAD(P)/FAD-dependent oxidoreductase [Bacteroides sp.]